MTATVRLVSGPDIACNRAGDSLSLWSEDHPGWLVLSCLGCIAYPTPSSLVLPRWRHAPLQLSLCPLPSRDTPPTPPTRWPRFFCTSISSTPLHLTHLQNCGRTPPSPWKAGTACCKAQGKQYIPDVSFNERINGTLLIGILFTIPWPSKRHETVYLGKLSWLYLKEIGWMLVLPWAEIQVFRFPLQG